MSVFLADLLEVARTLGVIRKDVVFTGGSMLPLLLPVSSQPRHTDDVDCIVEVTTYAEYAAFAERLRLQGLSECMDEGAPMCRWLVGDKPIIVDIMPTHPAVLGMNNHWFLHNDGTLKSGADSPTMESMTRARVIQVASRVLITAGVALFLLYLQPNVHWGPRTIVECRWNLSDIGTLLATYASKHGGRFPASLAELRASYPERSGPWLTCPAANFDTYSAGYRVNASRTYYCLCCSGHHHAGMPANYPTYTPGEGVEQSHPARPLFEMPRSGYMYEHLWFLVNLTVMGVLLFWTAGTISLRTCAPLLEGVLVYIALLTTYQHFDTLDLPDEWISTVALATYIAMPVIAGAWVAWRSDGHLSPVFALASVWMTTSTSYMAQSRSPLLTGLLALVISAAPCLWRPERGKHDSDTL